MPKKSPERSNPNRVLNAIGMKLNANNNLVFILVEGDTDKRLFKKFFDDTKVDIEITYGKQNLLDVVKLLHQNKLGSKVSFFALKDSDFDKIKTKKEIKVEILESSLRISYRIEDFKRTELYSKIIEWERQNGKEVFKNK